MRPDLFGPSHKADPQRVAEVKEWVAEAFRLGADVPVLVTELRCTEPGCPPLETVIAVLSQPGRPRQYKVPKPLTELTRHDVARLGAGHAAGEGGGEPSHERRNS